MASETGPARDKQRAINVALNKIEGIENIRANRELAELPSILQLDELPEAIIQGRYNDKGGILVATDRRLIFVHCGFFSTSYEDFPYDKFTSIQPRTGVFMGGLTIYAAGNGEDIKNTSNDRTIAFAGHIRTKLSGTRPESPPPSQAMPSEARGAFVADELEKLTGLLERGILKRQEFQAQKEKLLGGDTGKTSRRSGRTNPHGHSRSDD